MKASDKILLFIYSLIIAIVSIILIILPIDFLGFSMYNQGFQFLKGIRGNYIYSIVGILFLAVSIRFLFFGFKRRTMSKGSSLVLRNELGEVIIYSDTIVGLVQNVVIKNSSIRNINTKVDFVDGQIDLALRGEVSQAINIPQASRELQESVKQYIEEGTGAKVRDIKIEISNVAASTNRVR